MLPTLAPGDWLLVDPTTRRWPRRGSIVVVREPLGGGLAVKRIAGRPGDRVPFADGFLHLADDEAWLLSDASGDLASSAGCGEPIDSRRYGAVPLECLVGRVWLRYAPVRRFGRVGGLLAGHPPRDPPAARS
jgi:signal peptidase I